MFLSPYRCVNAVTATSLRLSVDLERGDSNPLHLFDSPSDVEGSPNSLRQPPTEGPTGRETGYPAIHPLR